MKDKKYGNLQRMIAAILLGVVLIFMIGIVANGWQENQDTPTDGENSGEGGNKTGDADNPDGDTAVNGGTADNNTQNKNDTQKIPEFINYLTGTECTEEEYMQIPFAFMLDSGAPLYGISDSSVAIEIPIENGETRLLLISADAFSLGKLGSFTYTRDYMLGISDYFGAMSVFYGKDDVVEYGSDAKGTLIDLSGYGDSLYHENGKHIYISGEGLKDICATENIDNEIYRFPSSPYTFSDFGKTVLGNTDATKVTLPYASSNETVLSFDRESQRYILYKDGKEKKDMLNSTAASYTNVFVLFADTVTYETSRGTETVVDTAGKGSGYYISMGKMIEIRWKTDKSGNLVFEDLNGDKLTVNRGNSYIGYYKSSHSGSVVIE